MAFCSHSKNVPVLHEGDDVCDAFNSIALSEDRVYKDSNRQSTKRGERDGLVHEDRDINDVFDCIALSEDRIYKDCFENGIKKGEKDGLVDGFHLGYHKGAAIGAEIGYFVGVLEASLVVAKKNNTPLSSYLIDKINGVLEALKSFPNTNCYDIDIYNSFNDIKAQYRKVCSLLKVDGTFPEKTTSLTF